jgi:hypothetical protein
VGHAQDRRGRVVLAPAIVAFVLLALAALVLAPSSARAYKEYQHGGIDDCETCHTNAHTLWVPTDEHCITCHTGYQTVRTRDVCWTCHTPGQDMSWARTDSSCLSTCHLQGDVEFAHTMHAGGSAACTSCHPLTASGTDPAGSPHHAVPTPRLDAVVPAAAAPGASVTLTGARLSWVKIVRFDGTDAAFSVVSDTQVVATVPADAATGPVGVLSQGGSALTLTDFIVLRPEPPAPPALTLAAWPRTVAFGRKVRLAGTLAPADAAAQVRITIQRRVAGAWKAEAGSRRTPAGGVYAWSFRPGHTAVYRARGAAAGVTSGWVTFRVR